MNLLLILAAAITALFLTRAFNLLNGVKKPFNDFEKFKYKKVFKHNEKYFKQFFDADTAHKAARQLTNNMYKKGLIDQKFNLLRG